MLVILNLTSLNLVSELSNFIRGDRGEMEHGAKWNSRVLIWKLVKKIQIVNGRGERGYFERGLFCTVEIWMCFSTQISIIFVHNVYFMRSIS